MNILSIQLGHNATVALLQDGEIKIILSQEKFDYIKNSGAFPQEPIKFILRQYKLDMPASGQSNRPASPGDSSSIDAVAICGTHIYPNIISSGAPDIARLGFWPGIDYRFPALGRVVKGAFRSTIQKSKLAEAKKKLIARLGTMLGVGHDKIFFVDHHTCHAYTPYFGFLGERRKQDWAVLTSDGVGDFIAASVSVGSAGDLQRISATPVEHSLGYVYAQTTEFLGMKSHEHEYKVMGQAAYVKKIYGDDAYDRYFKDVMRLKNGTLEFDSRFPTPRFFHYLKEKMVGVRFDIVSYCVQRLTEDMLVKWVERTLEKTSIPRIAAGGGTFMNVKANMKIAYMEELEDVFFTPSAGDDSNPIGAAYYVYMRHMGAKPSAIKPVSSLYLGMETSDEEIARLLKTHETARKHKVSRHDDIDGTIAELLAKGKVVARFAGKNEWGARALGNRSILGDPSKMETFFKTNDQIKQRDFWMPFAPTILAERADEYIHNPLHRSAPYMILAFDSTPEGAKELPAALHRGDHTLRPQVLEKSANPRYYRIIKEFEKETGIGAVLNTSFNLHGYPLVATPEQALHVFENSQLEYLALENHLIERKGE